MTQKELILRHMKEFGSITAWDALMKYGITRLADIIYKLKKDGYEIESEMVVKKKGERTINFSRYSIKK